jgi:Tol biopolymer transport system component
MTMRRLLALVAVVALSACAAPAAPATPGTVPSVGPVATKAAVASAVPSPTPLPTQAGAIERGGLLFTWYAGSQGGKAAFVVHRDGSELRRIMPDVVGDIRALGWAPDGNRMTFVVRDTAHPDGAIWSAAADGSGAALFYDGRADGCTSVFHPVWAPDGTRISLVCYVDIGDRHDATLAVLEVATKHLTPLVTYAWPDFLDNPARWSHDGTRMAFDVLHWDPTNTFLDGSRIATIEWQGSHKPRYLNGFDTFAASPAWSPDDGTLLYNTYDFGNMVEAPTSDLFSMRSDGSDAKPFLTAAEAGVARIGHPEWDPTNDRIWTGIRYGTDGYHIAWLDPDTKALTVLPTVGAGAEPRP